MIVQQEDRNIASLLPPEDAKQVLLALFSRDDDLPEMTLLAQMAYTALKEKSDRIIKAKSKAGKADGTPKGGNNAAKQAKTSKTIAEHVTQAKQQPVTEINSQYITSKADEQDDEKDDIGLQERRFAEFWEVYPRKVGKEAARKAWRRIKPTADHQSKILAKIKQAKNCDQWKRDNGQYIPNPATWLNQGRWDDEIPTNSTMRKNRTIGNMLYLRDDTYEDEDYYDQFISVEFGGKKK